MLESTGKSSFGAEKFARLKGGPFTLKFRMKSNASGRSSVFYNKPSKETLVGFAMKHDDRHHEYAVELPVKTLKGLRFNPSKAEGTIEVDWIRILDNAGTTVRSWDF